MSESLTPGQRRTLPARRALARKFSSPEEKTEHYRQMAEKANAGRVVLSGEDAEAVRHAYALLADLAARNKLGAAKGEGGSHAASLP